MINFVDNVKLRPSVKTVFESGKCYKHLNGIIYLVVCSSSKPEYILVSLNSPGCRFTEADLLEKLSLRIGHEFVEYPVNTLTIS